MNQRISTIIHVLKDGYTTVPALAEQFRVSTRTIRNDLKEINQLLLQNNLPTLSILNGGKVTPPENFDQLFHALLPDDFYSYKLSPEERVRVAATMLVSSPAFVTMAEIAENLFVSRATVINDLDALREFISQNEMALVSKANKGLLVEGKKA